MINNSHFPVNSQNLVKLHRQLGMLLMLATGTLIVHICTIMKQKLDKPWLRNWQVEMSKEELFITSKVYFPMLNANTFYYLNIFPLKIALEHFP